MTNRELAAEAIYKKIAEMTPYVGTGNAMLNASQIKDLAEAAAWLVVPAQPH